MPCCKSNEVCDLRIITEGGRSLRGLEHPHWCKWHCPDCYPEGEHPDTPKRYRRHVPSTQARLLAYDESGKLIA